MVAAAKSTNETDDIVNSTLKILNQTTQNCSTGAGNTWSLSTKGCDVNITNVTLNQTIVLNSTCLANIESNNDINQKIDQQIKQLAIATAESAFGGGVSSAEAANIIRLTNNLSQEIKNQYFQTCVVKTDNNISLFFDCTDNPEVQINLNNLETNQNIDVTASCVLKNSTVNSLKNELQQVIDQSAKSTATSTLSLWMIIVIIVVIIIIIIIIVVIIVFAG